MKKRLFSVLFISLFFAGCRDKADKEIVLATLEPGHFHAALVQKTMYKAINPNVYVYAPLGPDLQLHLERINSFNRREQNPTSWKMDVYSGPDFFKQMISEKKANVVVLSGNNQKKTEYILSAIQRGFHVYADKPMAINGQDFNLLEKAFKLAAEKDVLLYDIMTERFEINTILQKEISLIPEIFGTLETGSAENPAVSKESVHHFYKYVSGSVLKRPAWFFDSDQSGEGIVDVTTHLVDLIQWECFPDQQLDYKTDITLISARHWPTDFDLEQFKAVTGLDTFPDYLEKDITGDILRVFCNGEINYKLKNIHAKVSVSWAYKAPEGTGDTHYSIMRGSKANLVIRQGEPEKFISTLYIEPIKIPAVPLTEAFSTISQKYPGVTLFKQGKGWQVIVPSQYQTGHEEHFKQVTEKFIDYFRNGKMPPWEVPNMLAKYYTTTKALELAKNTDGY